MKIRYIIALASLIALPSLHCSIASTAIENSPLSIKDLINDGFNFEYRIQGLAWDLSGLGIDSLDGIVDLAWKYPRYNEKKEQVFPTLMILNNNNLTNLDWTINFPELLIIYAANNNLSNDMDLDFATALANLNTLDVSGNNLSNRTLTNIRSKNRELNVINKDQ